MASGAVVILGGTGTLAPTAELLARRGERGPQAITLPWGTGQVLSTARLAQLVPELPDPLATMDSTARWLLATARRGADGSWELPPQYDGS